MKSSGLMNRAPLSDSQGKKAEEKLCCRSSGQVSNPVGVVLSISVGWGGAATWLAFWRQSLERGGGQAQLPPKQFG